MLQEYRETFHRFALKDSVEVDNMTFTINRIELKKGEKEDFSITIWGRKPNAVTFEISRIFKKDSFFWKARGLSGNTQKQEQFSFPYGDDDLSYLFKGKDVVNLEFCEIEADTKLNDVLVMHTWGR